MIGIGFRENYMIIQEEKVFWLYKLKTNINTSYKFYKKNGYILNFMTLFMHVVEFN